MLGSLKSFMLHSVARAQMRLDGVTVTAVHSDCIDARAMRDIEMLRYRIYVEELRKPLPHADHTAKRLPDPDDAGCHHFLAWASKRDRPPELVGCGRVHCGSMIPQGAGKNLSVEAFKSAGFEPAYMSKVMVARSHRNGATALGLIVAGVEIAWSPRFGCSVGMFHCSPRLLRYYRSLGMIEYGPLFLDPHVGPQQPMLLLLDADQHKAIGSPLLPIAKRFPINRAARDRLFLALARRDEQWSSGPSSNPLSQFS